MGELRGQVTLDGNIIKQGSVRLASVDGQMPTGGGVIKDGSFNCRLPVATYRVEFSAVEAPANIPVSRDSDAEYTVTQLIPEKYNKKSELTWEVAPGLNERQFNLTTR